MPEKPHNPNPLNPPTKEMRAYWEALGEFIHEFTHIEKFLVTILGRMAGTTIPVSKAIFSGVRIDSAKSFITRILAATKPDPEVKADLEYIFAQLADITKMRNDIVHHGTLFEEGDQFMISNRHNAHVKSRIYETPVSAKVLRQMTADLRKMSMHLSWHFMRGWVPDDLIQKIASDQMQKPWQYKPTSPSPAGKRTPPNPPKRPPQRPASRK